MKRLLGVGVRFLVVGGLSTLIELAIFNVCFVALGWDPVPAKLVSAGIALINAYFGNRQWAFRDRDRRHRILEIVLFVGVNAVCAALGAGILALGTWVLGSDSALVVNAVNVVSIGIVVVVRFFLYHFIVFARSSDGGDESGHDESGHADQHAAGVTP